MHWVYIFKYILFDFYEVWNSTDVVACVWLNIGMTNSHLSCSKKLFVNFTAVEKFMSQVQPGSFSQWQGKQSDPGNEIDLI